MSYEMIKCINLLVVRGELVSVEVWSDELFVTCVSGRLVAPSDGIVKSEVNYELECIRSFCLARYGMTEW